VRAVAFEFPTRIFATLRGLSLKDLDLIRRWSFDLLSIWDDIEAGLRASIELRDYFAGQIEQRRRKLTDDIIGDLVSAQIDGAKLTDEAIISFLRMLLPAGHETTYRASGNLLYLHFRQGDPHAPGPARQSRSRRCPDWNPQCHAWFCRSTGLRYASARCDTHPHRSHGEVSASTTAAA
jgi:cytochrome P450